MPCPYILISAFLDFTTGPRAYQTAYIKKAPKPTVTKDDTRIKLAGRSLHHCTNRLRRANPTSGEIAAATKEIVPRTRNACGKRDSEVAASSSSPKTTLIPIAQ